MANKTEGGATRGGFVIQAGPSQDDDDSKGERRVVPKDRSSDYYTRFKSNSDHYIEPVGDGGDGDIGGGGDGDSGRGGDGGRGFIDEDDYGNALQRILPTLEDLEQQDGPITNPEDGPLSVAQFKLAYKDWRSLTNNFRTGLDVARQGLRFITSRAFTGQLARVARLTPSRFTSAVASLFQNLVGMVDRLRELDQMRAQAELPGADVHDVWGAFYPFYREFNNAQREVELWMKLIDEGNANHPDFGYNQTYFDAKSNGLLGDW